MSEDINGWEDYTIDDKGNVFSKRRNKYLKQTIDKYGYCKVKLQKDKFGKDYPKKMHLIGMFKDGILLEKFYGTGEIKRKYNYVPVAILDCCKGKYKKMYGYQWKFLELLEEIK